MSPDRRRRPPVEEVQLELAPDLTAASQARRQTRQALGRWRLADLTDPVLLAVSELVGNAVRHGRPPVDLLLRRTGRSVRLEVHDEASAPEQPLPAPDPDAESGRGLLIVDAVATGSGISQVPGDGKIAWADFEQDERRTPPDED